LDQEQALLREQELGTEAKYLLDSPLLQKILKDLRGQTISAWRNTKMNDAPARENAYHLCLAIDLLERHIVSLTETGELATIKLKRGRKPKESNE
jgi:hypothetical protein